MAELEQPTSADQKSSEGNYQEMVLTLNSVARSLKVLEDKVANIRNKTQLTDQNLLTVTKKVNDEAKLVNSELLDVKRSIAALQEKLQLIVKELQVTAKAEEFKVLERYIQLWDPVQFTTRQEVEKMIREILASQGLQKEKKEKEEQ